MESGRPLYFALWFLSFYLSFFSSPNLSGRRSDVYHTCTHGVALVRILNAGVKCAARGSLEIQDAKNRHFGTIAQLCRARSSEVRHVSTIGKNLLNTNTSSTCPDNMVNFGLLTAEICLASLGQPCKFQRVSRLGSVTARHSSSGRQLNCGVEQRAPPIFSRAAITLGIGPHSSLFRLYRIWHKRN